jgi:NADH:ubiquinone oxidoreductase subunit 5 (subunit L)/multisubunit Na+/H+ antiporter MnhA subunit
MPRTTTLVIVGSLAIAALPPLNGFASEWLIYLGLIHGGVGASPGAGLLLLFAVAAMAAVGVLAALCFVRLVGIGLLGRPRSDLAAHAHESGAGMLGPMAALAIATVAMPFLLPLLADALQPVIGQLAGSRVDATIVGAALAPLSILGIVLWTGFAVGAVLIRRLLRRRRESETWGCGYVAPTARMQYSGASFAEGIHRLLPRVLRAKIVVPPSTELFLSSGEMSADRRDPFTRSAYEPLLDRGARRFGQLRWVQQGRLHLYILYLVLAVVVTIAVVSLHDYAVLP